MRVKDLLAYVCSDTYVFLIDYATEKVIDYGYDHVVSEDLYVALIAVPDDGLYVVEWDSSDAMWIISDERLIYSFDWFCSDEVEVVGNVYDSPKLVAVKKR